MSDLRLRVLFFKINQQMILLFCFLFSIFIINSKFI